MMECVLRALVLLAFSCFPSEPHVAALPAVTVRVRVGEDATLHCPLLDASGAPTTSAGAPAIISWYRKAAGRAPQLLVSRSNSSHLRLGSGVAPGKVSAAADGSLLLRGSQRSDAAVYYCGISHGDERRKFG